MSLVFNANAYTKGSREARTMAEQWDTITGIRKANEDAVESLAANVGRTPADTYREFDSTTKIEVKPAGHLALLTRAMQVSRPVNVGKQVFEYRQSSRAGNAQSSMSGRKDIVIDHSQYGYAGTVVPVHDDAFGRPWREQAANASEMFDALVDDARESERTLMEKIDNYMWDGDSKLNLKGNSWLGLRNDPSVATATLGVDLTSEAVEGKAIRDEIKRVRDILRITNDCTEDLLLVVSRECKSRWEDEFDSANSSNVTVEEMILKLSGISEVIEDSALEGNQISFVFLSQQGFHPVVGMPISTEPVERRGSRDDYNFIKWAAVGFIAKQTKSGKTCALYAE